MSRCLLSARSVAMLPAFGLAAILLWCWLACDNLRDHCSGAVLTVTGHLRHRPDPALERTLRAAFTDLDKELAAILAEREGNQTRDRQ
jgi:hypothetical protein